MPTRRDFHALVFTALAAGLSAPRFAAAVASPDDKILNRLTFGANEASRASLAKSGLQAWLDEQLAMPPEDDALKAKLGNAKLLIEYGADRDEMNNTWPARKELLAYQYLNVRGEKLVPLTQWEKGNALAWEERIRPAREVQSAVLIRAVHGENQLREVMTQFWHDHFNVNSMRDERTAAYFAIYDKTLRENAFGNFRKLLGEVTKSPAMLCYLNNDESRASPANENFARELFELHTFGAMHYLNDKTTKWRDVPGAKEGLAQGYIDQDVYEAARALTGWSVGDGRWVAEGDTAPRTGEFHYVDRWHDPYQKRILGVEFDANQGPMEDGEQLLDLLGKHPATAKFVCTKICRRLVADEPSEVLINTAIDAWTRSMDAPDQIAQVIRAVALSDAFASAEPRKMKRPFEFFVSFHRAVGADVMSATGLNYLWMLSRAGWNQHEFRPPTGHADVTEHWANTATLSSYVDISLNALEEWTATGRVKFVALVPAGAVSVAQGYQAVVEKYTGQRASDDEARSVAKLIMGEEGAMLPDPLPEREWIIKGLVASAAMNPQFLFR